MLEDDGLHRVVSGLHVASRGVWALAVPLDSQKWTVSGAVKLTIS